MTIVETLHATSLHHDRGKPITLYKTNIGLNPIIRSYKAAVSQWCKRNNYSSFSWQPRFYDHIIRADGSLDRIRDYIINNPAKWENDKDNPANLWM